MENEKFKFLIEEFVPLLHTLKAEDKGKWGVMNAQQMVEHFTDAVKIANGKTKFTPIHSGETLEKYRTFMLSDTPFKENTKNSMLSEEPAPVKTASLEEAIEELQSELIFFMDLFEQDQQLTTTNPVFGELNFEENIHLLHKHAVHHAKQFGLV